MIPNVMTLSGVTGPARAKPLRIRLRQACVEKELTGTTEARTLLYYVNVSYEWRFELACRLSQRADRSFRT